MIFAIAAAQRVIFFDRGRAGIFPARAMPNHTKIQKLVNAYVIAERAYREVLRRACSETAARKCCAPPHDMYCFFARSFLAAHTPRLQTSHRRDGCRLVWAGRPKAAAWQSASNGRQGRPGASLKCHGYWWIVTGHTKRDETTIDRQGIARRRGDFAGGF